MIELVLRLQRSDKTSRTSSKPHVKDRKEQREHFRPGGAKPGHEDHSRMISGHPDAVVDRCARRVINLSVIADAFKAACQRQGLEHRKTRPYTSKTNGMVECFNGRVQREVLGITLTSHRDLEIVLRDFNTAYNGRRQRVLDGLSPEMVLRQRLDADPALANPAHKLTSPSILKQVLLIVADAKEVSHPGHRRHLRRGQRPPATLAVQRPPRRTLFFADPRL